MTGKVDEYGRALLTVALIARCSWARAIAFGDAGQTLYFAARHVDRRVDVHRLPLSGATSAPVVWRSGPEER